MPPQTTFPKINIQEEDVVKLILDFLETRHLHISQLSLERETGSVNGSYSDDVLFLRQLVLDGQWDDVLEFIQPLEAVASFNSDKFRYLILKQKYIEMLCIKCEAGQVPNMDEAVEEIVKLLNELEPLTPSKDEYKHLCYLLTVPNLNEHKDYSDWNPNTGRVLCFRALLPLVEKFLPLDKKESAKFSKNDRLMHLLIKGLLYEACLDYCQKKAMSQKVDLDFSQLLHCENVLNDSDLSLLSWLQYLPNTVFNNPFEQITLNISIERLHKPSLEAFWTEHMLVTPIKPKLFPHTAMPYGRPRPADIMSRSLNQSLEGLPLGHGRGLNGMTKSSLPSFHLTGTGKKPMDTSVDRLFGVDGPLSGQFPVLSPVPEIAVSPPPSTFPVSLSSPPQIPAPPPCPPQPFSAPDVLPPARAPQVAPLLREYQTRKKDLPAPPSESSRLSSMGTLDHQSNSTAPAHELEDAEGNRTASNNSGSPSLKRRSYTGSEQMPSSDFNKPQQSPTTIRSNTSNPSSDLRRPRFIAVNSLEDAQAVRCAEFHPDGKLYAVGSNSKTLRICAYPEMGELSEDHITRPPSVLFKRTKHHKGSIYCLGWNPAGDLIATGSNDKTVKLMRFSTDNCSMEGPEVELTMHDGTIRDVCFIEDSMNKSSLLISGGAGDCKVYVTDCATGTPFQALSGHTAPILSLYTWGGAMFASGSQDKTVRFWDLRTGGCVSLITPMTNNSSVSKGSPVASTCVDPSGRLLVTGHEDGACVFYDIRGSRHVQMCKPHSSDVRSVRFSPSAYYLLTAGYDGKLILTDLQGDLTRPLPSVSVAQHSDKAISARWHSSEFSFVSTSADKTCTLWALPPV